MADGELPFGAFQLEIYGRGLGGEIPALPILFDELEGRAREQLAPEVYGYVAGGAGEERTIRHNREAFDRWRLVPRMLRGVAERDLTTEVLGTRLSSPVMLAPVGVLSIVHEEGELAVARAAAQAGAAMVLSTAASTSMEEVAGALGDTPRWYQLYPPTDHELGRSLVARAEAAGYTAIVVTVDTLMMPWRPRDIAAAYLPFLRGIGIAQYTSDPVFRKALGGEPDEDMQAAIQHWATMFPNPGLTWDDLEYVREATDLPVVVKGILHPDDAQEAADRGFDGVVVSNHGGRQVDGSITALDALPGIAEAVPNDFAVLFDSGIRTGSDVVKALALGADAVLVGRPWVWGLGLGGEAGALAVVRGLLADLDLTMAMCGLASLSEIGSDTIRPAPG